MVAPLVVCMHCQAACCRAKTIKQQRRLVGFYGTAGTCWSQHNYYRSVCSDAVAFTAPPRRAAPDANGCERMSLRRSGDMLFYGKGL
eukprot:1728593-Pleurochrysis_carterae.AAC.1